MSLQEKLLVELDDLVMKMVDEIPFDTNDLPEFAGRLFDFCRENPKFLQIDSWRRHQNLECPPFMKKVLEEICYEIQFAQEDGILPIRFAPAQLFSLITKFAAVGSYHVMHEDVSDLSIAKSRKLVCNSVALLLR
ncbi:MAG: hypothetical protein IJ575_05640 [Selenomonadaceae bacterium]|nr:hypothetical protein [Selenomonadaceae bacterium]